MTQPIAGVSPPEFQETTIAIVWPSIAAYPSGRFLGRLYSIRLGFYIVRAGNLLALASIPHAIFLYFWKLLPWVGTRYHLTNRRLIVERGMKHLEEKSVELDRYSEIEIVVRPGQAWFHAGDLVFRHENVETFRLEGVSRPESFRQICLKAQRGYVGVQQALAHEASPA